MATPDESLSAGRPVFPGWRADYVDRHLEPLLGTSPDWAALTVLDAIMHLDEVERFRFQIPDSRPKRWKSRFRDSTGIGGEDEAALVRALEALPIRKGNFRGAAST
jgi:hypothetical protein